MLRCHVFAVKKKTCSSRAKVIQQLRGENVDILHFCHYFKATKRWWYLYAIGISTIHFLRKKLDPKWVPEREKQRGSNTSHEKVQGHDVSVELNTTHEIQTNKISFTALNSFTLTGTRSTKANPLFLNRLNSNRVFLKSGPHASMRWPKNC